MRKLEFFGVILAFFLIAACVPNGTAPREHTLRILDAETGEPVSGAVVNLHIFPSRPEAPEPDFPWAAAKADGAVKISSKREMAIWQIQAEGYIEQRQTGDAARLPPRYAAHAENSYDGVIYLYRLPEPQLSILVGDGYSGPLTLHLQPAPGFDWVAAEGLNTAFAAARPEANYIQEAAGLRLFTVQASEAGEADLVVAPLLYDVTTQNLLVQDGAGVLPYRDLEAPPEAGRFVWGSVSEDDKKNFHQIRLFIGTREEYLQHLGTNQQ